MTTLATCWNMTINNPDENDYALVRQPNTQYVRHLIWTEEVGKEGTPHLQCWLKIMKQQRMSFVKKLFPRAKLIPLSNDEYNLNTANYVQKNDDTTTGAHVHNINPQVPDPVGLLTEVIEDWLEIHWEELTDHSRRQVDQVHRINERLFSQKDCFRFLDKRERELIEQRPYICKLVLSPMYTKAKKYYWKEILENRIQHKRDADDNEGEGTGESELHETKSTGSSDSEEEEGEEGSADEGSDTSNQSDSSEEGGDEAID